MRLAGLLAFVALTAGCCGDAPRAHDLTGLPPLLDEVEAFEERLRRVIPYDWQLERLSFKAADPGRRPASQPWAEPEARAWVISTPWPGTNQRLNVMLFLVPNDKTPQPHHDRLASWERFSVTAQDPSIAEIGGVRYSWDSLPGWPDARAAIVSTLR